MMKILSCVPHERRFDQVEQIDALSALPKATDQLFWLDLTQPTEQELAAIAEAFQLHPLAIEDAGNAHQRPKVEEYQNFFFLVFYIVHLNKASGKVETQELKMFVGQNYLITVHQSALAELAEAEERWRRNNHQLERGIGILLYSLLDSIVDDYFPVVDALVDAAEELEDTIYAGATRGTQVPRSVLDLKKQFVAFRRVVAPERDVLNVLTNRDSPIFDEHLLVYFRDVSDHLLRVADTLDLYRDQLGSTMDASLAVASNNLNVVMRTLTAMSIILMTDALLAGIWGMNFTNIPELHWQYGYFAALGLMAVLTLGIFLFFKRLKWW
ncbi:MAG TPA: magnesium/cobalt transporter CorA [Ktedonobacterales bacterium]|nr:magnesium/cobalt transporter CorA [Ktedonobacterales bacterium]